MQTERQSRGTDQQSDRRRARSSDPKQALELQLSHVRHEAHLDALVLASREGLPIAHAGDEDLCCELAALAPLLGSAWSPHLSGQAPANGSDIQQGLLFVRAVELDGESLYLASCGDNPLAHTPAAVDRWLLEATAGVRRILAA
jgi:hypothetical protein